MNGTILPSEKPKEKQDPAKEAVKMVDQDIDHKGVQIE